MDTSEKVKAIEARMRALQDELNRLAPAQAEGEDDSPLVAHVRERVERAIGAEGEGAIEAHVGAVWLSRLAVLLVMTFLVLGARFTVGVESLGAVEKLLAGYGVAALFCAYAFWQRKRRDPFTQAMLGCGLAALYFASYALFFVEETRLVHQPLVGIAVQLACLGLICAAADLWRSQTVAGIGLFLAYYTVVLSGWMAPGLETLAYTLATCCAVAIAVLLLHQTHQWLFLSWGALLATHGTYLYFFWRKPDGLDLPDAQYFWLSNAFLTLCYVVFSLVAITDARRRGEYRRTVAPLALVNSIIYFGATYAGVREAYPAEEWLFRAAFAAVLLAFALLAETAGPRRNYLYQVFLAKAVVLLTLALHSGLPPETLLVALAVECAVLALAFRQSGVVLFKILGLGLALFIFARGIASLKMAGQVDLGDYTLPANWFNTIGVAAAFLATAFLYERFGARTAPTGRTRSGHWFLADSRLDLSGGALALLHAAAAAILLLTFTILERGEDPALPFLLAAAACIIALLGVILFTPQIEIASVLLLVAAHVCYHVFLWMPHPGFEIQESYLPYSAALAGMTYVGAHAFERYLARFKIGPRDLDHHLLASVPYLAATFLIVSLIARQVPELFVPPACAGLGLALLLVGVVSRYPGIVASALLAMVACGAYFSNQLYNPDAPLARRPDFLLFLALMFLVFIASERLLYSAARAGRIPQPFTGAARSGFVLAAILFGVLGLHAWAAAPDAFVLTLFGLGTLTLGLGAIFGEPRYRWAGLLGFLAAVGWTLLHFQDLTPIFRLAAFGAAAAVLLVISWAYSRFRRPNAAGPPHADV